MNEKNKPMKGFRSRYLLVRNAMYRYLKEKDNWMTSAELIKAFEDGSMLNCRGRQYLMSAPSRPQDLSLILRRDKRFVSKMKRIASHSDGGNYEVKFWGVTSD